MVFCNASVTGLSEVVSSVTILILIDGFLQSDRKGEEVGIWNLVTILILIDGFLQ